LYLLVLLIPGTYFLIQLYLDLSEFKHVDSVAMVFVCRILEEWPVALQKIWRDKRGRVSQEEAEEATREGCDNGSSKR
jgi:hypothetical protein